MITSPDFSRFPDQLVPAIIQDAQTRRVLMLGYMNAEAWAQTQATRVVTFFSRSRQALWVKGETSGNFLHVVDWNLDCDQDAILIHVNPVGPVCHTGAETCWNETNQSESFLPALERTINARLQAGDPTASYTARLAAKGINKVAQKVGEEAVELVIEAKDENRDLFLGEAADLFFHTLVLLRVKGYSLAEVEAVLRERHKPPAN
jgi:phosphoribosyl-ATP pyrophosphohydrolase/phosphoribosyl-AMP cyclohydrolase